MNIFSKVKKGMVALSATGLLLASCTDDLDQNPHIGFSSETVYTSAENYEAVLAKIYALFAIAGQEKGGGDADLSSNTGYDLLRMLYVLQCGPTDEMITTWLEGDHLDGICYMQWDANDQYVADAYYRCYYNITLANEFLRNCDDAAIATYGEELRAYRAEARFLRALSYWYVLDLFRQGPFVTENDAVGAYAPEAADANKLFDYIYDELSDCAPDMLAQTEAVYGRASRAAAYTLLARLCLNAEVYIGEAKYTECIDACNNVLAEGYSLEPEFAKLFNADNHKRTNEIFYHVAIDATNTVTWGASTCLVLGAIASDKSTKGYSPSNYGAEAGWGNYRYRGGNLPTSTFPSSLNGVDSRYMFFTEGQSFNVSDPTNQSQGYLVTKWTNLTDEGETASDTKNNGVNTDFPMFRLADVYLMYAEAVVRGGQGGTEEKALELVNLLRERAYGNEDGNITAEIMKQEYFFLYERGREMMWELTRRTDLIRFGCFTTNEQLWDLKGGVQEGTAVDDKYNYYPIPATELTANPNLSNKEY